MKKTYLKQLIALFLTLLMALSVMVPAAAANIDTDEPMVEPYMTNTQMKQLKLDDLLEGILADEGTLGKIGNSVFDIVRYLYGDGYYNTTKPVGKLEKKYTPKGSYAPCLKESLLLWAETPCSRETPLPPPKHSWKW